MLSEEIRLMSTKEAAKFLGTTPHIVCSLIQKGLLDHWIINGLAKTNLRAIERFLDKYINIDIRSLKGENK